MKKILALIFSLLLAFCAVGCALGRVACSNFVFTTLSDDLFNKRVLQFHDVPWLKKPENITKKSAEKKLSNEQHIFEGYIQDEQSFWDYGEYIYDTFVEKKSTIGVFIGADCDGTYLGAESWTLIKKPTSFEDCYEIKNIVNQEGNIYLAGVEIYYSEKAVDKEYNSKKGGYEMLQPRRINLTLIEEQDGSLVMEISCRRISKDVFFVEI